MKRLLLAIVCSVVLFFTLKFVDFKYKTPDHNFYILTIKASERPEVLAKNMRKAGVEVLGIDLENGTIDVVSNQKELFRNVLAVKKLPEGPDRRYVSYETLLPAIEKIATARPELVSYFSIGKSVENRDIFALKISDRSQAGDKISVFFNGMHHAREVMTTEVVLNIARELTENYETNAKYRQWLSSVDIYLVPMVNPDGNHRVWNGQPMWRKNAKDDYGVDLNRNYPYKWSECNGSSGSKYSDTYRGPSAGSEPETKAIMNFVKEIKPKYSVSYHSYSEIVIYPYSCQGDYVPGVDGEAIKKIGEQFAKLHERDSGSGSYEAGTSWELLYPVDGGDIDWLYAEVGTLPFVVELNSSANGFQPSYDKVKPTLQKVKRGWEFMLETAYSSQEKTPSK